MSLINLSRRRPSVYVRENMRVPSRPLALLAVLMAALLCALAPAGANTLDVHADYLDNGVIDRSHQLQDLRDALAAAEGDVQYEGLRQAVEDALDAHLLGRVDGPAATTPAEQPGNDNVLAVLPVPPPVDESGGPPWPLLAASLLAGMLALSGAGTSLYRRLTRGQ